MVNKIQLAPRVLACTAPTFLVGVMVDGKPNFLTIGLCGGVNSLPPMVSVSIRPERYSMKGILQNREFSVNVPSIDQVKETNYCGVVSGANVDKVSACKFNVFFGTLKHAPLIEQCPVNMECTVEQILDLGSHRLVIGKVVGTHINDTCLTDGRPDVLKIKPLIFTAPPPDTYHSLGKTAGRPPKLPEERKKTGNKQD